MSRLDERYERYADIFEDPETAESIELGRRVLHKMFMENFQASTARLEVASRARQAEGQVW